MIWPPIKKRSMMSMTIWVWYSLVLLLMPDSFVNSWETKPWTTGTLINHSIQLREWSTKLLRNLKQRLAIPQRDHLVSALWLLVLMRLVLTYSKHAHQQTSMNIKPWLSVQSVSQQKHILRRTLRLLKM